MTTADSPARALPRTSENLLLHETGEGTTVQLAGIVKEFGATRVLHGVDLDIAPGEFVSLLGPSGCGKTTLLRILAGLEDSTDGTVSFDGKDVSRVPTNKRDIGMVFQSYSLFPHLRVVDNTAFGLRRRGFTPGSLRLFSERVGVSKAHQLIDPSMLDAQVSTQLGSVVMLIAPRGSCAVAHHAQTMVSCDCRDTARVDPSR